jgi:hypothetical protein
MKRLFLWTGTFVLGLTALMWTTASISAPRGGGGEGRGGGGGQAAGGHVAAARVGGGRPVARTGSIHFGARAGRDPAGPAVSPGQEAGGAHRNPYRADYARHFRPGYRSMMLGGSEYYLYDSLPSGCQTVLENGVTYDLCEGVYYQPYFYAGQTMYMVVPM